MAQSNVLWRVLLAAALLLSACRHPASFTWVAQYSAEAPAEAGYLIVPGDTLNIQVWNQPGMSGLSKVRGDGKISVAFLNDVSAAGIAPNALAQRIQAQLKEFINNPVVTVALEQSPPLAVSVLGEVSQTGVYTLDAGAGVLQALAAAGGLGVHGDDEQIYVLRREAPEKPLARIRFRLEDLTRGEPKAAGFRLRRGDVVVVE